MRRLMPLLAAAIAVLAGCSSYVFESHQVRTLVEDRQYDEALERLHKLGGGSRLLGLYESSLVLQEQGRWTASDSLLDQAEQVLEDLYTHSLRRDVGALLVNDGVMDYRGDAFETAFLHYYRMIGFIARGDMESAAVQARRLGHQLQLWRDAGKPFAGEGFFAYFSGLVFREAGAFDDAGVAFRNADAAYHADGAETYADIPAQLASDLAETPMRPDAGRVVLLLETGYVPYKDATEVVLPIFKTDLEDDVDAVVLAPVVVARRGVECDPEVEIDYWLRLSIPRLVATEPGPAFARLAAVAVDGRARPTADTVSDAIVAGPALDVAVLSHAAFVEHEPAVLLRAAVRGCAKYLATRKAKKENKSVGLAVNFLALLSENADTRCWSLLPRTILLARAELDSGEYRLVVDLLDPAGSHTGTLDIPPVVVQPGRTTFIRSRLP